MEYFMPKIEVDVIDRSILKKLQENGRLSNVQLAAEVGLSESACLRRVKLLEENGIIDRFDDQIGQVKSGYHPRQQGWTESRSTD